MQQNVNLNLILDQVAKDKGIDRQKLIEILEESIGSAAKRHFGMERNLKARYDEEKGQVDLFQVLTIVADPSVEVPLPDPVNMVPVSVAHEKAIEVEPGDELDFPIYYRTEDEAEAKAQDEQWGDLLKLKTFRRSFGRIAAQTAKQVMIQGTRNAERENVFNEYKDRKGELITGTVRRFERGNIIVDLGRAEAILPVREQVPRESYRSGDRIVAFVVDIDKAARGPQIILSRASVDLLKKLFEMEVPEIYEKIVRIESSAREPGARAKIAVSSRDRDVDPVGACVGMKGSRVQAVVQELRGEKIDIVPYDDDPARFVCNAIAPAEVSRVIIDAENHRMELIVPDDKLSLAIGKKGQNVRLASQLTGWKIDIHSESKIRELEAQAKLAMASLSGVGFDVAETLFKLGWRSVQDLAEAVAEELGAVPGLGGQEAARRIIGESRSWLETERRRHQDVQRETQRRANLSDEQKLLEIKGVDQDVLAKLKEAGVGTVPDLAHFQDMEKLVAALEGQAEAAKLVHWAKVYLGELPPGTPEP